MAPPMATDIQKNMDSKITSFSAGLTVDGVAARRSKAKQTNWGIAAHTSSDMFKGPVRPLIKELLSLSNRVAGSWKTKSKEMGS